MATVYIPSAYKDVAERLAKSPTSIGGKPIFPTYMHLMAFAAMVGYAKGRCHALESKDRGPEVYDDVFERNKLDGLVYLLALNDEKDGNVLKENREHEGWRLFEGYAAAGLEILEEWLLDSPGDTDGVETVLTRVKEFAAEKAKEDKESLQPQVEF